jgi:hypothetical protein
MSRRLFALGSLLLLATVGLWLADAFDWIQASTDDHWSSLTIKGAAVALAGALLMRLLSPVATVIGKGRCAICGRSTQRGHIYCLDHLQETVNVTRDQSRRGPGTAPRARPQPRA